MAEPEAECPLFMSSLPSRAAFDGNTTLQALCNLAGEASDASSDSDGGGDGEGGDRAMQPAPGRRDAQPPTAPAPAAPWRSAEVGDANVRTAFTCAAVGTDAAAAVARASAGGASALAVASVGAGAFAAEGWRAEERATTTAAAAAARRAPRGTGKAARETRLSRARGAVSPYAAAARGRRGAQLQQQQLQGARDAGGGTREAAREQRRKRRLAAHAAGEAAVYVSLLGC